jgi:phosphoribosylaminoimidazolecarboxamide formyltransferase/IMP cyclohydrolase
MEGNKKIRSALISVYHKENLDAIVQSLHDLGVLIYSTGGTSTFIKALGIPVNSVEDLTGYPSILGGRVKTLHPRVFGGILARRENADDLGHLKEYKIPEIDLVIVDLYPFEETVALGAGEQDVVEKIDIGGISLIRAAAKNYRDVLVVPSRDEYIPLLQLLADKKGISSDEDRRWFAARAFGISSHYDAAIFRWISKGETGSERISLHHGQTLRYGENPHQKATFYRFCNTNTEVRLADANVLQGKELSYNNMLDADSAWKSASDALHSVAPTGEKKYAVSVVKHLNPCGLAVSGSLKNALELAWAGDPVSAYGSIVCLTGEVNEEIAGWFDRKFVEIIIAPAFTQGALENLSKKKNLRLLVVPVKPAVAGEKTYRSISGGMLVQDEDEGGDPGFTNVTEAHFDQGKLDLAKFGVMACKNLKSNAIALVSQTEDGSFWLTGAGMGQPNRLDSLRQLTIPRFSLKQNVNIGESVLVSDAYFPFRDSIDTAREYNIRYIVQPGGSIRDREVIDACNESGIAMVFTGRRHFRH